MPETHELRIARAFWYLQRYPDLSDWEMPVRMPRFTEPATINMAEEPYLCGRGRTFRLWPSRWALVVGRWGTAEAHETAGLRRALAGRDLPVTMEEIRQWPGGAADELPDELADTTGVIAWKDEDEELAS